MGERATAPLDVVRAVIAALNRGDIETALSYCAEDVVLWVPGSGIEGQEVVGKEPLRQVLEFAEERWPEMWSAVRTIVADGERVAIEMTAVASEGGRQIAQPMAAFFHVRDGLIVEQRSYYDLGALGRLLGGDA